MRALLIVAGLLIALALPAQRGSALSTDGAQLFDLHCAGCHPNGGNIIRRGRSLKLKDLSKRGLDNPEAIAAIAREGIGQMSGYGDALGEGNEHVVGEWVWLQAQNAWTQG
ncbi:cytochrome c553 (cytochrome c6) [Synechococcus sp. PROS-7-1]|uniref:c-type cytochrome n=1 Tax=Synechococcus sp. PROS-7-1 TaxID=1442556 RepID=UPI0016485CF6|nr:c-type cytochrome [Synechococcus sp. PROS-7-1]QNI84662.1 cytochrome c553 (cytochrome c6) [Synechococcus sp. PROS-7-1]